LHTHPALYRAYHRALHTHPALYRAFHKPHHVFTAPFCWSSHATHPVEMLLQSLGAMVGPALLALSPAPLSLHVLWLWLAARQAVGVLDHCGFALPHDPSHLLPGAGGVAFHDDHHKHFTCNYASTFSFIDDIMGTLYSNPREGKR